MSITGIRGAAGERLPTAAAKTPLYMLSCLMRRGVGGVFFLRYIRGICTMRRPNSHPTSPLYDTHIRMHN